MAERQEGIRISKSVVRQFGSFCVSVWHLFRGAISRWYFWAFLVFSRLPEISHWLGDPFGERTSSFLAWVERHRMLGLIFILVLCVLITYHELRKQIVDWPGLRLTFDPVRHVIGRDSAYQTFQIGVETSGTSSVERAQLKIVSVEPASNKRKLSPLVAATRQSYLNASRSLELSDTFSVDPQTERCVTFFKLSKSAIYFNRVGATRGENFPLGSYQIVLFAHGKNVKPCKRLFQIKKSRSKKNPLACRLLAE